jgi:aminomethyltransferase
MNKKTPLFDCHKQLGARLVGFAGWEMPVQYKGPIAEHMAVREHAGLFDVSHMGRFEVRGPDALAFVDFVTANDPKTLHDFQAQYTLLLNENGGIVDDLLVYRRNDERYFLVVNAATTEKDWVWLKSHIGPFNCTLIDHSAAFAQMAIQGPTAERILQRLTATNLDRIPAFSFGRFDIEKVDTMTARTGYTGEDGFEIYCFANDAKHLWNRLLVTGAADGLEPCGLAARNTLRLEAKMMLYGTDMNESTTALEAALGWVVRLDKGDFIGRDAIKAQKAEGVTRRICGFEVLDRVPAREGYEIVREGRRLGVVTSGSPAPFLKKNIGLAYLPVEFTKPGTDIDVIVRGRTVPARVVKTPFYTRKKAFD